MKHLKSFFLTICVVLITGHNAFSSDYAFRGQYQFTYFGFSIYDAALFMDQKCENLECDFILKLIYQRSFDKEDIVNRSIQEIDALYDLDKNQKKRYKKLLLSVLVDVQDGDIIDGKMINSYANFYHNNKYIGKVDEKKLSKYFFDIWLSPQTSEPEMRNALLNNQ
ncbi:MAG: hypothetical protein ACJAQ0_000504 [Dasania sp.]|jgi:hypothetical protein